MHLFLSFSTTSVPRNVHKYHEQGFRAPPRSLTSLKEIKSREEDVMNYV